ncbi:MAG TPA: hypothetical protein VJT50_13035 [Pyrinomonadaceae bacterium]|nr:hypothetical protein [Pyrinomonadaceae bacterium]
MSKINRRDYLKGMAASAGVMAASKLEVFDQRSRGKLKRGRPREQRRKAVELNWNITEKRPDPHAFVTVIFSGLMGFAYESGDDTGIVGFHRGNGDHKLIVKVYRYPCGDPLKEVDVNNEDEMTLAVVPESNRRVAYFENDPFDQFNRLTGDPNDFRWLPDLDSRDFYEEGYDIDKNKYHNRLRVKNATFYTRLRTNSTFDLVTPDGQIIRSFGHVARYMAAAIERHLFDKRVLLTIGRMEIPLEPGGGAKYQVLFSNECDSCEPHPVGDLTNKDETKRNDFHFARDVMNIPSDHVKIGLKINQPLRATDPPDICGLPMRVRDNRSSDEAPCMGAGYGNDRL